MKSKPNNIPTLTIMPDFGSAYGWYKKPGASEHGLGGCHADGCGWSADPQISEALHGEFADWQAVFETHAGNRDYTFDWQNFHHQGVALTIRLKQEVGNAAIVVYEKPFEDPNGTINERVEVHLDGSLTPLMSRAEINRLPK